MTLQTQAHTRHSSSSSVRISTNRPPHQQQQRHHRIRRNVWGMVNQYYDSSNHIRVLFQQYGSVWCKVLPFCFLNMGLSCTLVYLMKYHNITLDISTQTHSVLSVIAAFLSVTKISLSLDRYQQLRAQFSIIYREPREFIHHMAVFTRNDTPMDGDKPPIGGGMGRSSTQQRPLKPSNVDPSTAAPEWRNEVAFLLMILVRTVVAAVSYDATGIPAWNIPELMQSHVRNDLCSNLDVHENNTPNEGNGNVPNYHEEQLRGKNFRVPIRIAFMLRELIYSQRKRLNVMMEYLEESTLFNSLTIFMTAYHEIVGIVTTPIPFPLVQMSRTFLFFYIYTLPSALLTASSTPEADLVVLFIVTYGFIGLELISIELDDPFGDDVIDFDTLRSIHTVYDDICCTIRSVDGNVNANTLRSKLDNSYSNDSTTTVNEKSKLLPTF